jgi:hypothetical protein
MPFETLMGSFHLGGESGACQLTGFRSDADSLQFKPAHASLRDRLERRADVCRVTSAALNETVEPPVAHYATWLCPLACGQGARSAGGVCVGRRPASSDGGDPARPASR